MRKDLESWLRGETPPETEPEASADGLEEDIEEDGDIEETETAVEKFSVKDLSELDKVTELQADEPQVFTESSELSESSEISDFSESGNFSESSEPDEPDELESYEPYEADTYRADDNYENSYKPGKTSKKRSAWKLLGAAGKRLSMRMRQGNNLGAHGVDYTRGRGPVRRNRARLLTLCAAAVILIGTAIALFRNAQRNAYDAIMEKADGLYGQQQYAAAFEAYGDASSRYPDRPEPLLGAAHAAERMGRAGESIAAYNASLERLPPDASHLRSGVFYEIGRLHSTLKAWGEAQKSFEEAIAADAANYAAYFSLGDSLEEQNQPDKALLAYKQAQELSPSSDAVGEAVRRVTLALAAKEEDSLLEQKFTQAFSSGSAALEDRQYREASQYFAEALAIRSGDADAWVGFAEARGRLGDRAGERKSLERALERDPEHEAAKSKLAEIEARNGRNAPPAGNTAPRSRNSSSPLPSPSSSMSSVKDSSADRKALFNAGVEQYGKGEYEASFNSFVACLRSSERELLPSVSLAGQPEGSTVWRTPQTKLDVPAGASLLAEIVRLNPNDRDLYVNLLMAGAQMGMDRDAMRSLLNEARSHARERSGA